MASTPDLNPEPTFVGGECCNHYTTLAPQRIDFHHWLLTFFADTSIRRTLLVLAPAVVSVLEGEQFALFNASQ